MRQFLTTGIIALALMIGATGSTPVAHAQGVPCDGTNSATCIPSGADTTIPSGPNTAAGGVGIENPAAANAASAASAGEAVTVDPTAAKSVTDYGAGGKDDAAYAGIMSRIMTLFAWLVGVAALTLDNAVFYTVVTMGGYLKNLTAIGVAWRILRDFGNIMLIFGFLAIGISVILNTERIGYGKKMLPMLLVAAVFLNFSLFFAEAIVDAGNLFATQFYTQINNGVPAGAKDFNLVLTGKEGISNIIMGQLGLQNIYGKALSKDADVFKGGNPWLIGFMGILLFLVTAFVMFSLAFILIARFVALIFLIVLAPIGFAGLAVPQLEKKASQWWGALIHQTVTAPILLLMLYVALAVITDANFLTGFGSSAQTGPDWLGFITKNGVANLAGFGSAVLSFVVAMGLLIAVTIQAKNLSAFGADWATRMGGRLSFGAVSLGGRVTLGGAGNLLASKRMQSWARKGGVGGLALKGAVLAGKGLRSSTYDVRNLPAAGGLSALGVDAGKGATITAKQAHDAQYGVKPVKEWLKHSKEEREAAGHEIDFQDAIESGNVATIRDGLSKMSSKQIEELSGIKSGVDALVTNLSPQQFESLMKSDKLDDTQKGKIKDARYRQIATDAAEAVDPTRTPAQQVAAASKVKSALDSMSKGELEAMPSALVQNQSVLDKMSDKQRDTVVDSKQHTATVNAIVRGSSASGKVEVVFNSPALGGPAAAGAMLRGLSPSQIAKLKTNILRDHDIVDNFTPAVLVALQEEKKLGVADIAAITANINAGAGPASLRAYIGGVGSAYWT